MHPLAWWPLAARLEGGTESGRAAWQHVEDVMKTMSNSGSSSGEGTDTKLDSADKTDVSEPNRELITRLVRRRAASGLSQADVARRMGTSQSAVARLESRQHDAQLSTLTRYAEALGLSLDFAEDTSTQARDSTADARGVAAGASSEGQVSLERSAPGASPHAAARPKGPPGRKPKGSVPTVVTDMPDRPDPDHVLTWRQRKILQVIRESVQHRGYAPTMREIAEAVGLTSASSVSFQLATLQSKGYLRRDAGRSRTVEVRPPGHPAMRAEAEIDEDSMMDISSQGATTFVPVVGRIAAGGPILAEEAIEEIFPLPKHIVGEGPLFLLKVIGDSMINAAIADGDWVVVRQQEEVADGDIVAAMIDGEATVKTFKRSGGHVWLMPHNPAYVPIPGDEASILGLVVALLRRF